MSSARLAHRLAGHAAPSIGCRRAVCGASPRPCLAWTTLRTSVAPFSTQCRGLAVCTPLWRAPKIPTRGGLDEAMPHSTHFDVQDIDANRLTHYYWDKDLEEDVMSPYDYAMLLDEMSEWDGESIQFVEIDDRELLNTEYLQ